MLSTESRTQRSLLEWIIDGRRFFENVTKCDSQATEKFREENRLRSTVGDVFDFIAFIQSVDIEPATMFISKRRMNVLVIVCIGARPELR